MPDEPGRPVITTTPSAAAPYGRAAAAKSNKGSGRGWVLAVAILQLIGALIIYGVQRSSGEISVIEQNITLAVMVMISAIFFGLWIWAAKAPFAALLTALIFFVSVHLLDAVLDPLSLARGIILKIAVIIGLSNAIKKAYSEKRERELAALDHPV